MTRTLSTVLLSAALAAPIPLLTACGLSRTLQAATDSPSTPVSRMNEPAWKARWEEKEKLKARRKIDLLFLGDSILDNYERKDASPLVNYRPVWDYYYGDRSPFDLGFAGDTTGNLLWRIGHGETTGLDPRLVVLLIGTNNTSNRHRIWSADADVSAIRLIVDTVHTQMPSAHVLVVGILPSGQNTWKSNIGDQINRLLAARYDHGTTPWTSYQDVGYVFLSDGRIDNDLFVESAKHPPQGAVHPTALGQARMSAALEPTIARLLSVPAKPPMPARANP